MSSGGEMVSTEFAMPRRAVNMHAILMQLHYSCCRKFTETLTLIIFYLYI